MSNWTLTCRLYGGPAHGTTKTVSVEEYPLVVGGEFPPREIEVEGVAYERFRRDREDRGEGDTHSGWAYRVPWETVEQAARPVTIFPDTVRFHAVEDGVQTVEFAATGGGAVRVLLTPDIAVALVDGLGVDGPGDGPETVDASYAVKVDYPDHTELWCTTDGGQVHVKLPTAVWNALAAPAEAMAGGEAR